MCEDFKVWWDKTIGTKPTDEILLTPEFKAEMAWNAAIESTKQTEWISVKDRLPEDKDYVVIAFGDTHGGVRHVDMIHATHFHHNKTLDATHWMPLPESPEVENA